MSIHRKKAVYIILCGIFLLVYQTYSKSGRCGQVMSQMKPSGDCLHISMNPVGAYAANIRLYVDFAAYTKAFKAICFDLIRVAFIHRN